MFLLMTDPQAFYIIFGFGVSFRASVSVELKASGFNLQLLLSYYSQAYSATPVWLEVELCGVV
jgi:hypothetical protein